MRSLEPLRLGLLGILLLFVQLAWYTALPHSRAGIDIYAIFLLLLAAARGPVLAGAYAVAGGAVMDSFSNTFVIFHMLYYLLPVALGSLVRSYMITEYRLLGTLTVAGLLLAKVIAQLAVGFSLGWLSSPLFIFRVNYWSIALCSLVVYLTWPYLSRLIPSPSEVKRVVG